MGQSASKEKFAESVRNLIQVEVSPDDAEFWDELWKIPSSAQEVFELISADSARQLRDDRFGNLATLFTQAVAQLCQIVETPYNIYFDQALNCVRVLTRILPFLLEKGKCTILMDVLICCKCCGDSHAVVCFMACLKFFFYYYSHSPHPPTLASITHTHTHTHTHRRPRRSR